MIKIKSSNGKTEATIEGSLTDIIADSCIALRSVWSALREENEDAGKIFEKYFRSEIDNIFSEDKELKERCKDLRKERENTLDEIMSMLDELLESLEGRKGE